MGTVLTVHRQHPPKHSAARISPLCAITWLILVSVALSSTTPAVVRAAGPVCPPLDPAHALPLTRAGEAGALPARTPPRSHVNPGARRALGGALMNVRPAAAEPTRADVDRVDTASGGLRAAVRAGLGALPPPLG